MLTQILGNRVYDYTRVVGGRDVPRPVALAIGPGDLVFWLLRLPSRENSKVSKLSIGPEAGDEQMLGEFGTLGSGDGQFIWPAGIAVDSLVNVYVTDEWLNRVSIFDQDGSFLSSWGSPGAGDGELNRPSGIAIDPADNLYIVDSLNHRVQKFTKDGKFQAEWGGFGSGEGEFDSPWGITVDHAGFVYVADHKNHRVQKFTPEGAYVAAYGSYGTGRGELTRPTDVAVDPDGDVYVCDWTNKRVQAYDPDGGFITSFIGDAQVLSKWQQQVVDASPDERKARRRAYTLEPEWRFALPTAVAFHQEKGWLMVADTQRNRVQIYSKLKDYVEPQFNL